MKTITWGILGTGMIARKFAEELNDLPNIELHAVGSRTQESANAFANDFGIPVRHSSYEALAADPKIDAIYIASPHTFHKEHSLLCLGHGKAVLCEKPFALNLTEATEMVTFAKENRVFLMEAMWTRFLPHMVEVTNLINEGVIGDIRMIQSDFGFRMPEVMPEHRLFNPDLGGGALLDVGIYPVSLAHQILGKPSAIKSFANLGSTHVDEEASILMHHSDGQISLSSTAIRLNTPHEATILGTEGRIQIHGSWWQPSSFTLHVAGQEPELKEPESLPNGYNYEAMEVSNCLREGKLESSVMPLNETLEIMETLDMIRAEWGLTYPNDGMKGIA